MSQSAVTQTTVEEEVAELGGLPLSALRERWTELFGSPPPQALREKFLAKACAYQIQVQAHGGLSAATKRRLRKIAEDVSAGKPVTVTAKPTMKPGTRLVRAWGGEVHTVTAVAGGFEYDSARYTSLSAVAREITGTSWNGREFFGLKRRARGAQKADNAGTGSAGEGDGDPSPRTGNTAPASPSNQLETFDV